MQSNQSIGTTLLSYLQPIFSLVTPSSSTKKCDIDKPILLSIPKNNSTQKKQKEEKQVKSKSSRYRTKYASNRTAAIALTDSKKISDNQSSSDSSYLSHAINYAYSFFSGKPDETPKLKKMEQLEKEMHHALDTVAIKKIGLVADEIKEHAARRVDLFFYLLIAVYNKKYLIHKDSTIKQHGTGSKKTGTHACHSSLFPNLKIQSLSDDKFLTPKFQDTMLSDTLNMTVELPVSVNAFDGELEGGYRHSKYIKTCLDILNRASKGIITPKEGMNEFVVVINTFFTEFNQEKQDLAKTSEKICEYQKEGTFMSVSKDRKTVRDDYLYLMLRLKPNEIRQVKEKPDKLELFYKRIQDEIYQAKSEKTLRSRRQQ